VSVALPALPPKASPVPAIDETEVRSRVTIDETRAPASVVSVGMKAVTPGPRAHGTAKEGEMRCMMGWRAGKKMRASGARLRSGRGARSLLAEAGCTECPLLAMDREVHATR
jgi:hypothetical protein